MDEGGAGDGCGAIDEGGSMKQGWELNADGVNGWWWCKWM